MSAELILPPIPPLIRSFVPLVISISSVVFTTYRLEILVEAAPFGLMNLLPLRFLVNNVLVEVFFNIFMKSLDNYFSL